VRIPGYLNHTRRTSICRVVGEFVLKTRLENINPLAGGRAGSDMVANQYQSTMDALPWMAHSCVMQSRQERSAIERSLVSVVDDDESVRESLPDLLREFGFAARVFSSAEEFLASDCVDQTRCLILDIAMPGMTGPDLQRELKLRRQEIPIVFVTAHRDETVRPRVLEQGAVECLFKPFSDTALLEALNTALRVS
jgi:CheY-like chemotaxis protein